jgi:hypothetical protein
MSVFVITSSYNVIRTDDGLIVVDLDMFHVNRTNYRSLEKQDDRCNIRMTFESLLIIWQKVGEYFSS